MTLEEYRAVADVHRVHHKAFLPAPCRPMNTSRIGTEWEENQKDFDRECRESQR